MIDLSIIIVSWNIKDFLRRCLSSIYKNPPAGAFEIFVVDNNSNDGTVEMIKKEFPDAILIENNKNLGFARANNQALRVSKDRYALLLNPDTEVLAGTLDGLINFMDNHPFCGALGCKIVYSNGNLQRSCRSFPTLLSEFWRNTTLDTLFPKNKLIGKYHIGYWEHNDIREVEQLMGACIMARRKTLEETGLLDEQYFMYYEEVDLCYRIKKAGWKIYFTPEAEIIHYAKQSSKQADVDMLVERNKSLYRFFKKHYGRLSVYTLRAILFIGMLVEISRTLVSLTKGAGKRIDIHWLKIDPEIYIRSLFF